jgi:hypothetical protein
MEEQVVKYRTDVLYPCKSFRAYCGRSLRLSATFGATSMFTLQLCMDDKSFTD